MLWLCTVFLAGCLNNSNDDSEVIAVPVNGLDFPSSSAILATDGDDLDVAGIVVASTGDSIVNEVELSIDDGILDPLVQTPASNSDADSVFYWRQVLVDALPLGFSDIVVDAIFGERESRNFFSVIRGSSWMWQSAIQFYDDGAAGEWLVLDTANRELLSIDIANGNKTALSIQGQSGIDLDRPVDFAIDGDRALVVDKGLAAVIAIALKDDPLNSITRGDRSIFADLAAFSQRAVPVAIEIARGEAYIVDQLSDDLIVINDITGATGVPAVFAVNPGVDQPEFILPLDIAYHEGTDRLFVSDANLNGVIAIAPDAVNPNEGSSSVLTSPKDILEGTDCTVESPPDVCNDPEDVFYVEIKKLLVEEDTLYVSDNGFFSIPFAGGGFGAIFTVALSSDLNIDGDREVLSDFLRPSRTNAFNLPQAIAFSEGENQDAAIDSDDRLLVLDNQRGVIVSVEPVETESMLDDPDTDIDESEIPVSLGRRTFLPGGSTLDATSVPSGAGEFVSRAQRLNSGSPGVNLDVVADVVSNGEAFFILNEGLNTIVRIALSSGLRTESGQISGVDFNDTDEQQAIDQAIFENTRFDLPRLLQQHVLDRDNDGALGEGDTNRFIVVDAYDDTVIGVPPELPSTNLSVREEISLPDSSADSSLEFNDPRAMVVFEDKLYVINGENSGRLIEIDMAGAVDSNRKLFPESGALAGCTIGNPTSMLLYTEEDNEGAITGAWFIVSEAGSSTLRIIDQQTGMCTSVNVDQADMAIVDMQIDTRNAMEGQLDLLLLDKGNDSVFSVRFDPAMPSSPLAVAEILTSPAQTGSNNQFVSPVSMALDSQRDTLFVLDDVLRSVYMIDIAQRDADTGQRVESGGIITGQRFVISRGTSLNCQPAVDDLNPDFDCDLSND